MKNINKIMGYTDKNEAILNKAYLDAMDDEDFKLLIKNLHLSENMIKKYLPSLSESAEEFSNCSRCKRLTECKNKVKGHAMLPKVDNGIVMFDYRSCKYQNDYDQLNKYKNLVYSVDIPTYIKVGISTL
jgi:hypothetical protein